MQFIDLKAQQHVLLPDGRSLRDVVNARISALLDHGQYILGPEVDELELRLSKYVGVDHCIAVASGTDALLIALMALGVGPGDEIITTPFSFIATAETIALLGAVPIFADIDPRTYNLDPSKIDALISSRTKAIIPVSLYGQPADFLSINKIAESHGIPVIEDGAQSFGAQHHGKRSCSLTTIATTSFFPSKPLGGYGDGGACFTNNAELADLMRRISRHGQLRRYYHTNLGVNGRIDTLQAAVLLAKLEIFESEVVARQRIGDRYNYVFQTSGIATTPYIAPGNTSVYAQYTLDLDNRTSVQEALKTRNVPFAVHYPTLLCQQPALRLCCGIRCSVSCSTPCAQRASERVISLPMHPYLSESDQDQVIDAILAAMT